MPETTVDSMAEKHGNDVGRGKASNKQKSSGNAPNNETTSGTKKRSNPPLSAEKLLNEIREFDFNYRWYFTVLALEFVFVTLIVISGFVLIGYYSDWNFQ